MANRRWRSEPGHREGHLNENVDGLVNPFWSQGAMVDGRRPTTLPQVPGTPGSLPPVTADEWDDGGEEAPQSVQGLLGAMGSGGGIVRSQGPMPSSHHHRWHFKHLAAGILKLQDKGVAKRSG